MLRRALRALSRLVVRLAGALVGSAFAMILAAALPWLRRNHDWYGQRQRQHG
ncbi:hypothetical protein [Sphingomonas sp.]|uniref:hypothetical protein n=1 Tax=Sphingomonas sp. TaxID=28214 RepID=UPI0025F7A48A|nr:hypothetical protein [Sphingomonas sp.]